MLTFKGDVNEVITTTDMFLATCCKLGLWSRDADQDAYHMARIALRKLNDD